MESIRNVVLFGECGVGKSSIINAIIGQPVAKTSNDVQGCTYETTSYPVALDTGIKLYLWDTIGLDEGTAGRVPADLAKQRLKTFLQGQLATSDGVDLLLYCVRGASGAKHLPIKRSHWANYKFVFEEVCKKRIPIAMVVTHLESYDPSGDMDVWWKRNEQQISEYGFQLCAHACVTILPPDPESIDSDASRVEISRRKLRELLSHDFLAPRNVLLLGDREDRDDFLDMIIPSKNKQSIDQVNTVSPFTCIPAAFDGHTHVNFWNMDGFEETDDDALTTRKNLKLLVRGMKQTPGLDVLVFCFRAGSPKIRHARCYRLFYAAICRKKVPVAIVILGPDEGADTWWQRNEQHLVRKGFLFDRHIYIPWDPCRPPSCDLDEATRCRLVTFLQGEHTTGSWNIGDNPFWITTPNVRAVVGELTWPTTTVVVCDATRQGAFVDIAPDVQAALRHAVRFQREHRFQQVDPQTLLQVVQMNSDIQLRIADQGNRGTPIGLLMFFICLDDPDDEMWKVLEKFYSIYDGAVTPLIVVVCGALEEKQAEDLWRVAPRQIRRQIGAYLTYYPGSNASPETKAAAQENIVDMIQSRRLVDLGEKVGLLQEILSIWRKYRSQRTRVPATDGVVR